MLLKVKFFPRLSLQLCFILKYYSVKKRINKNQSKNNICDNGHFLKIEIFYKYANKQYFYIAKETAQNVKTSKILLFLYEI